MNLLLVTPDPAATELDFTELYKVGFKVYWTGTFDLAGILLRNQKIDLLLVDTRADANGAFDFFRSVKASKMSVKIGILIKDQKPPADIEVDFTIVRERFDQGTIAELKKHPEGE
jgi:DNA-binding response OmpR family regulator